MKETRVSLPELALIGGTRAALGAGIGLLLADRFSVNERRAVGWTLFLIGAITTIPLAFEILGGNRLSDSSEQMERIPAELQSELSERLGERGMFARG